MRSPKPFAIFSRHFSLQLQVNLVELIPHTLHVFLKFLFAFLYLILKRLNFVFNLVKFGVHFNQITKKRPLIKFFLNLFVKAIQSEVKVIFRNYIG